MTSIQAFFAFLSVLQAHSAGCSVAAGRDAAQHVLYGGSCVQAFLIAIHVPDAALLFN